MFGFGRKDEWVLPEVGFPDSRSEMFEVRMRAACFLLGIVAGVGLGMMV